MHGMGIEEGRQQVGSVRKQKKISSCNASTKETLNRLFGCIGVSVVDGLKEGEHTLVVATIQHLGPLI